MNTLRSGTRNIVLVVEDDAEQRETIAGLIKEFGLQVIECCTADAAFAVMQEEGTQVMLVFTDVRLPGVRSGVDLAHDVAEIWPATNVIVTSGSVPDRPLPSTATFLLKPWRALDILARVV